MENTSPQQPATPEPAEPMIVPMEMMEKARQQRQVILRDPQTQADELIAVDAQLVEALAQAPATLSAPLLAALLSGQYVISLTWRSRPQPPDDLLHHWEHHGLAETDVVPALQFIARDFLRVKKTVLERQASGQGLWS